MGGRGAKAPGKTTSNQAQKTATPKATSNKWDITTRTVEAKNRYLSREKATVIDLDGNVIFSKGGGKSSVGFTASDTAQMRGAILTHNHPEGNITFSEADINTAVNLNLKEIRATGSNGTFILRQFEARPGAFRFASEFGMERAKINKANDFDAKYRMWKREVKAGRMDINKANQAIQDFNRVTEQHLKKWLAQNSKRFGYEYAYEVTRKG